MKPIFFSLLLLLGVIAPLGAQTTSQESNIVASPAPTAAAPIWGKLVISGDTVTCYYAKGAATPTVWIQLGTPQTVGFINNPLLVGIYITACDNAGTPTLSTGTIDNFSVTPTPTYRLTDVDVGAPKLMGSANLINGVWNIAGTGSDIWHRLGPIQFPALAGVGRLHRDLPRHLDFRRRRLAENRNHGPRRIQ